MDSFNTLRQRAKKLVQNTNVHINKVYNNQFKKQLNKYIHIKNLVIKKIYKKLKPTKKPHTKNVTRKTIILVLKKVKSYNRAL